MKYFLLWSLILIVVLTLAFPFLLKTATVTLLERTTGLDVFLLKVSLERPGQIVLSHLRLFAKGRERFRTERVTLVPRWKSLLSEAIEVEKVSVERPTLWLYRHPDGSLNLFRYLKERGPTRIPAPKRTFSVQSFSIKEGSLEISDGSIPGEYAVHLREVTAGAEKLRFPLQSGEIPFWLEGKVGAGSFPSAGSLRLKGWLEPQKGDLRMGVMVQEMDLPPWNPYLTQPVPMGLARGWLDLEGDLEISEGMLRGVGLIQIHDLLLRPSPASALVETIFGISQEQLLAYLRDSQGVVAFPVKVSGSLHDPAFALGEDVKESIRQNLARTLRMGVGRVVTQTFGLSDLEKRAKGAVKDIEKTLRLDWLLTNE